MNFKHPYDILFIKHDSTPLKNKNMAKERKETVKNDFKDLTIIQKITGIVTLILAFMIFILDRSVSCLFFHLDYPKFFTWVKQKDSLIQSFVRVVIFMTPILIYKLLING